MMFTVFIHEILKGNSFINYIFSKLWQDYRLSDDP
jgi:hypothetical protein